VQHWWLPQSGQGVRTRISDDRAWLAYTVAQYVETDERYARADELIPFSRTTNSKQKRRIVFLNRRFLKRPPLSSNIAPSPWTQVLAVGRHGLPLIGHRRLERGMNRVGEKGQGESVWLGWFLHAALMAFAPLALARNETKGARKHGTAHAGALAAAIEREAWDGEWYRRGYFDDGTPLGSATNDECRIDSIAQFLGCLVRRRDGRSRRQCDAALDKQLIRREDGLALLFAPPFDKAMHDPGYIKGYPPGVSRERRPVHARGTWSVMAFAALGEATRRRSFSHCSTPSTTREPPPTRIRYKVEPYVACADIYSTAPHVGRGVGRGIPARQDGCSVRGSRACFGSATPRSVLVRRSLHSQDLGQVRGHS